MTDIVQDRSFWMPCPSGPGLSTPQDVCSIAAAIASAGVAPVAPPAEPPAPLPVVVPPGDAPQEDGEDEPRPARCIDMGPDEGTVSVRRAGDGLILGVLIDAPRDGAGMCFQPVRRGPAVITELMEDGIIG